MNCAFLQTLQSKLLTILVGAVLFVAPLSVLAQFNPEINYQGKLTDGTGMAVPDGTYNMNFWLVPTSGGATSTAVWSEARTGGNQVQVTNGLFSVMLGEVATLASVDFDQELYLAVEIGGTGSPSWDGELLPRKILGAVPAAFYAETAGTADLASDAELLGGVASSSFLRSDAADEMTASSTSPILSIIQNGVGKVLALFSGVTEIFTVLSNGNVGVGTTTPSSTFAVDGNTTLDGTLTITGGLYDNNNATGTAGDILVSTGNGIEWNATSTLGLGNGTFLGLSDTISSFTANRVLFTSGSAVTDSANFVFDGTNLGIGTSTPGDLLTVAGDIRLTGGINFGTDEAIISYVGGDIMFGRLALLNASNVDVYRNIAIGDEAGSELVDGFSNVFLGRSAALRIATGSRSVVIGDSAVGGDYGGSSSFDLVVIGDDAGRNLQTGSFSTFLGSGAGENVTTGTGNLLIGYQAGDNITDGASNIVIGRDIDAQSASQSQTLNIGNLLFGTGLDGTGTTLSTGNIGIGTTTPGSKLTVAGDLFVTGVLRDGLNASGTEGMILQTTGTSTRWVATSTLGVGNGTFLGLSDTISSFTANRILYTSGSAVVDSANFVFDGTNLGIGTSTPNNRIQVLDLIEFDDVDFVTQLGYQAGQNIVTGAQWNTFVGYQAGFSSSTASTNAADNNTGIGYRALFSNTSGFRNTAVGISALQNNTSGSNNTANGAGALLSNTSGASNSAFGSNALQNNTTGYFNTGIGVGALQSNTTGYQNTAVGLNALTANTSGLDNTAVGVYTLQSNTTGSQNVAFGRSALQNNTTASNNTAFGFRALATVTVGGSNTAIGASALESNLTGLNNTAVGFQAGFDINTATSTGDNTLIGYNTGRGIVTGVNNTILGANVTGLSSALSNNIIIADGAGNRRINVDSTGNVGIGTTTPTSRLSVVGDAYITGALRDGLNASGTSGMVLQTTGTSTRWVATSTLGFAGSLFTDGGATTYLTAVGDNLAIGTTTATSRLTVDGSMSVTGNVDIPTTNLAGTAGVLSVQGERFIHGYTLDNTWGVNQFMGYQSGNFTLGSSTQLFAGIDNLGIGRSTLSSLTEGSNNVAVGQGAMNYTTTGGSNTAVGWSALQLNTTGSGNSAVGRSALVGNTTGVFNSALGNSALEQNTTGERNVGIGAFALLNNTTGNWNVAVGQGALSTNVNGEGNVAVGQEALQFATSSYNTALGMFAGNTITTGGNNTILGANSGDGITTGENNTILGANVTGLSSTLSNNIIIADGAGNRRINVDSSGNVGIGTTSPTARLDVYGNFAVGTSSTPLMYANTAARQVAFGTSAIVTDLDGAEALVALSGSADGRSPLLILNEESENQGASGRIMFTRTSNSVNRNIGIIDFANTARITAWTDVGDAEAGSLQFSTDAPGAGPALTEQMRITSSGNIGIGTTTPTSRLTVAGDAYITGALRDGLNASGTSGMVLQTTGTSTRWVATSTLGFSSGGSLFTDAGAVTYLTATGDNLAVGTTTAGSKLTVDGDLRVYGSINFGGLPVVSVAGDNIFFGGSALPNTTNPNVYANTAIGTIAGNGLVEGWSNVFLGHAAGTSLATGSRSIIIGDGAVGGDFGTITAGEMVIIGDRAGYNLTTGGNYSTYVGFRAGENVTEGTGNTLLGYRAGDNLTTGYSNIVIGYDLEAQSASQFETLNIGNLIFGTGVNGVGTTLSSGNIGIGTSTPGSKLTVAGDLYLTGALRDGLNASGTSGMVLQSTGTSTRWVATSTLGFGSGGSSLFTDGGATTYLTSLTDNLAIGTTTATSRLTVAGDVAVGGNDGFVINGIRVLSASTTLSNIAFGEGALANSTGEFNVGIGSYALIDNSGDNNTAVGYESLNLNTTGGGNTAMGFRALTNNTVGSANTALGIYALSNNTTGNDSVAVGFGALGSNTEGYANTAVGWYALNQNVAGIGNTAFGNQAGRDLNNATDTGQNTFIGSDTGRGIITGVANTIIGAGVTGLSSTLSNNIIIADGDGNRRINVDSSGNVGIGTTTPNSRLTVDGDSQFGGASNSANISAGGVLTFSGTGGYSVASNAYAFTAAAAPLAGIYFNASNLGLDFMDTTGTAANRIGIDGTNSYLNSGNVGIGTTTPGSKLTVAGDFYLTGALRDGANASGTSGMVLQSTGTSTRWVATSTLGFGSGGGSLFTDAGAVTYLTDTADNLAIGTTTAGSKLTIDGDVRVYGGINFGAENIIRYTSGNLLFGGYALGNNVDGYRTIAIGDLAGNSFNTGFGNVFIGNDAAVNMATSSGSVVIGDLAAGGNGGAMDGGDLVAIGVRAGYNLVSGGNNGVMIGAFAGENVTTGGGNIMLGFRAGDNIADGYGNIVIGYDIEAQSASQFQTLNIGNLLFGTGLDGSGTTTSSGNIGIGTTTPESRLSIERLGFAGTGAAGLSQYIRSTNSTLDATQYGSQLQMYASNTATTTLIGSIVRVADSTTFGNTTRGLEIQADNGNNTLGENTGLAAFARTFGVRGTTVGNAGGVFEPAGVFGETEGTTQGNAIRGYSSSITSAALLKLFQDTSTFTGTGLLMNFGNAGGSFSSTTASRFIDLQNAGTSLFTVGARGMTTIGDGTTTNNAGLQIGYGGICVDNDGSCVAGTTGRITAVSYATANSDLAENYFSSDDLQTGEVVSLKGELSIERADENNQDMVLGVVTTKPGLLLGSDDSSLTAGEDVYGVALAGRVPVRLSNENGEIKAGDKLMLSSVPGVAMKASSTGMVVGIALEDFKESRAYSDTYINQFGDDLVDPIYVPVNSSNDPRINDGCYYGAGNAAGEADCVPLVGTTTDAQVLEAEALAAAEAQAEALEALKYVQSERVTLDNGEQVRVGQIVMFVSLEERYLDEDGIAMVAALLAAAPDEDGEESETETIWSRLVTLASNFVDGVLSVFTLKADRVEVTDEICVDGVCLNADDFRQLLDANSESQTGPEEEVEENPEPETPVEEPEEVAEEVTPEEEVEEESTEPEVEEETEEVVPEEGVEEVVEEVPVVEPEPEVVEEPEEEVEEEAEVVEEPDSTSEAPVEETP